MISLKKCKIYSQLYSMAKLLIQLHDIGIHFFNPVYCHRAFSSIAVQNTFFQWLDPLLCAHQQSIWRAWGVRMGSRPKLNCQLQDHCQLHLAQASIKENNCVACCYPWKIEVAHSTRKPTPKTSGTRINLLKYNLRYI